MSQKKGSPKNDENTLYKNLLVAAEVLIVWSNFIKLISHDHCEKSSIVYDTTDILD